MIEHNIYNIYNRHLTLNSVNWGKFVYRQTRLANWQISNQNLVQIDKLKLGMDWYKLWELDGSVDIHYLVFDGYLYFTVFHGFTVSRFHGFTVPRFHGSKLKIYEKIAINI